MGRSENLVPTMVVNKNGVLTTVHKKPAGASAAAGIPAPAVAVSERSKSEIVDAVMDRLHSVNKMIDADDMDQVRQRVGLFSSEKLERFERAANCSDKAGGVILHLLVMDDNEDVVNMAAHFIPDLPDEAITGAASLLRGLYVYPQLSQHVDYSKAESSVQLQCLGLVKVASCLEHHSGKNYVDDADAFPLEYSRIDYSNYRKIKDEPLVNLILERPEEADRMTAIIRANGEVDASTMRGLLDGMSPAFASGAL